MHFSIYFPQYFGPNKMYTAFCYWFHERGCSSSKTSVEPEANDCVEATGTSSMGMLCGSIKT